MPNLTNSDVQYYDPLEHPFDFRGMGAEHNSSLLWTNLEALVHDDLFRFYGSQNLIAGITDYYAVPDYDGSPIALYEGYIYRDDVTAKDDSGFYSLFGTAKADFILGMAGRDRLLGAAGADCLSGGNGTDTILGGRGNDMISGGKGADVLTGNLGADRFCFTGTVQSTGRSIDAITDFTDGVDLIDVSVIDASASAFGIQDFVFQTGPSFTGEGQIRAVQLSNGDTELRFNTSSAAGAEMTIVLRNVDAATISLADFIV